MSYELWRCGGRGAADRRVGGPTQLHSKLQSGVWPDAERLARRLRRELPAALHAHQVLRPEAGARLVRLRRAGAADTACRQALHRVAAYITQG